MKTKLVFFVGLSLIFISAFFVNFYYLPFDILFSIPGLNSGGWQKPNNSLIADPVFQFEPWRQYAKERILRGEFPLWNNLNGMGSPFFANPQTAVLYPLNFLYYLLPLKSALFLTPVLKQYLFFWFLFLYLRSIKCSVQISIVGSIVGVFSGFVNVWLLWPHTNVYILLPLLLYFTEKTKNEQKRKQYTWFILSSIVYCIGIFGGHPETLLLVFFTHVLYSIFRLEFVKIFRFTVLTMLIGFLLASIQLFPFIEYLLNSYSYKTKTIGDFLPLKSFIVNLIPFISGAPHQKFYKPIFNVNFQEAIGGYVGTPVLILAIWGLFKYRRESLVRTWGVIVFLFWTLAYKIWPFWLITYLPILNKNANSRFIGIAGFGIIIMFSITLEQMYKIIKVINTRHYLFLTITGILLASGSFFAISFYSKDQTNQVRSFLSFLQMHMFLIVLSSLVFFILLFFLFQFKLKKLVYLLLIPLFFQTGYLFYSYNSFSSKYYPESLFVSKLKNLPKGTILEVGNPNFPENINMIYNIPHAQNYDALEVYEYKRKFDKLFPKKNQWGNPDEVNIENVKKLDINYIVSDYDLNLFKSIEQSKYEKILPLTNKKVYRLKFKPKLNNLKQIRLLTANFNRENLCTVNIILKSQEIASQTSFNCKDIYDFMYFTIDLDANLHIDKEYELLFTSKDSSPSNFIGLWGVSENIPFVELLYNNTKEKLSYEQLLKEKKVYIFRVANAFSTTNIQNEHAFIIFYSGMVISLFSWISLLIFILRKVLQSRKYTSFKTIWGNWSKKKLKKIHWLEHYIIFFLSFICSSILIFGILKVTNLHFSVPNTTAINWLTVHNYPKQQDYFFVVVGTFLISLLSLFFWFLWILKRKR